MSKSEKISSAMKSVEAKLVQAVVLLDRQWRLIERLVQKHIAELKTFESACLQQGVTFEQVLDLYNYVYALIDHIARYQKIAASVPSLNQKSAEHRRLTAGLGAVKDARDQLQHINNDIENLIAGHLWVQWLGFLTGENSSRS